MAKNILVIEDESDIRTYLTTVLEDQGFETSTLDPHAALTETVQSLQPDLILLDVMMPLRSGISIYTELRRVPALKRIPVIIISGFSSNQESMTDDFGRMINDRSIPEPDGYIDKPVNLEAFISMIHQMTTQSGD